jgi:Bacterial Ig-like domain
MDSNTIDATTF